MSDPEQPDQAPEATLVVDRYPWTEAVLDGHVAPRLSRLRPVSVHPVHQAFDAMVADQRYDVCEIAVGAFLQARAAGRPLWLLPVVTLARHQHGSLYVNPMVAERLGVRHPEDLAGHRVAVRSYSQTTGLWVRGILEEEYGVDPTSVTWVTTEASHLPEFTDPPQAVRAVPGATVLGMLQAGEVVAAVHAPDLAVTEWCRPLVSDVAADSARFATRLGAVPINHLLCVGPSLADVPERVADVMEALHASYEAAGALADPTSPVTLDPGRIADVVERARQMAVRQGLVPPDLAPLAPGELFALGAVSAVSAAPSVNGSRR